MTLVDLMDLGRLKARGNKVDFSVQYWTICLS